MARQRSVRAHADPDHVGRHRSARLTGPGDEDGGDGAGTDLRGTSDPEAGDVEAGDPPTTVVPLFSVPDSLRSVDVAVGGRAVRGFLLVAVVLLLTLGGRWWWVNQQAAGVPVEQVVEVAGEGTPVQEVAPAAEGMAATAAPGVSEADSPAAEAVLLVHVIGQVLEPGVVELPLGSRVIDAVRAAGGVTDEADPASLNLARPVVDGEQVWVGAPGEEPPPGLLAGPAGTGTGGAAGGPGGPVLVIDLNQAGQAQLEELPGIGPVTAGHILAWREQHGRFTAVEELMEVSGIGEKTFEQLRPHVTVGG